MESALKELKILDLSMNLPGPYMTWLLASLGAEVIKIENPKTGDTLRHLGNYANTTRISPYFEAVNRNKKSLTLNLKKDRGKQIYFGLLQHYDLVVEGFRPGTMERLGIGFESAFKVQPKLIQVSMSGYGQKGPFATRAGYD
ncbi:MAG: CoA transferase, partial [Desulfobacterales bacterium]|nr:CoA transferase [Desulfobacterales bacterium]